MIDGSGPEKLLPTAEKDQKIVDDKIKAEPSAALVPQSTDVTKPLVSIRDALQEVEDTSSKENDRKSYQGYPLMWPSEDIDTISNRLESSSSFQKKDVLKTLSLLTQVKLLHRNSKQLAWQENFMSLINGDEALVLANKLTFHELVEGMSYTVPKQFVSDPAENPDESQERVRETFPDPSQEIFCKPIIGGGGRGVSIIQALDIPQFLSDHEDYILQEKVPAEKEFRYIRQIDHANQRRWRIAYERVKPTVVGDGKSTTFNLIRNAPMPLRMKLFATIGNSKQLLEVPEAGELRELSVAANPPKGSYEQLPDDHEMRNLDNFMESFIVDLEERVGSELPTLCFDIGVTNKNALSEAYDFEEMKKAATFFECQVPFSSLAYFAKIENRSEAKKALVGFHRTIKRERNR